MMLVITCYECKQMKTTDALSKYAVLYKANRTDSQTAS